MKNSKRKGIALAVMGASLATFLSLSGAEGKPPKPPSASLAAAGIRGAQATMQPVNLPARVARIAVVPGTGGDQAWAIGQSLARAEGWNTDENPNGQLVFLAYKESEGWTTSGPPTDQAGRVVNPVLSNFAFLQTGEGWAVGPSGALLHHPPNGGWTQVACVDPCGDLSAISLVEVGGTARGFAVGPGSTVLRLDENGWRRDSALIPPDLDLRGVATSSANEAFAIARGSSSSLEIYRRLGEAWTRLPTGQPLFDGPHPTAGQGGVNLAAIGNVAATLPGGDLVWIGGGIFPVDPTKPLDNPATSFVLSYSRSRNEFVSWCPTQYSLSGEQVATSQICDNRDGHAFPVTSFDVTSLSLLDNGEVIAGGLGLFRYRKGAWFREPNAVGYLKSVAFGSKDEGWVASAGDNYGRGTTAVPSSSTIGHFTARPQTPRLARWPQYNDQLLEAVALSPDNRSALAVGHTGATMLYRQGIGWDLLLRRTHDKLHGVAWSSAGEAWAVGQGGTLLRFDGRRFEGHSQSGQVTTQGLFGVAFSNGRGFAVGARGTILRFSNGSWSVDSSSGIVKQDLYAIAAAGSSFVAVGKSGTILSNPDGTPGGWALDRSGMEVVKRPGFTPDLYALAGLPNGTFFAGGTGSTLIKKDTGGAFQNASESLDGNIMSLAAADDGRRVQLLASVAPRNLTNKYQGELVALTRSSVMHYDGRRWHDSQLSSFSTTHRSQDLGLIRDPVLAVALDPSGTKGWAVGGKVENLPDPTDGSQTPVPTSSIFRLDTTQDPHPPNATTPPQLPASGFSFAFFSDSGCGVGYCSVAVGSNPTADTVVTTIQDEINYFEKLPRGPKFALMGGNMRATGIPEDLAEFRGFLSDFSLPVFGTIGPKDLFSPIATSATGLPPGLGDDFYKGFQTQARQFLPGNSFYLRQFADQARPWGTGAGKSEPDFVEASSISREPNQNLARTQYAIDYSPGGQKKLRIIFVDTSDGTVSATQNSNNQNPKEPGGQYSWLRLALATAKLQGLPTIVVMNIPTTDPTSFAPSASPLLPESKTFEGDVVANSVSAVLTGFIRGQMTYRVPEGPSPLKVPFYVMGGGGAPLGGTKLPNDGHYHGWGLVTVDTSNVDPLNPQAKVSVRSFPVIESVALHAADGLTVPGGKALRFEGMARAVDGGSPSNDPQQGKRTYIRFPLPGACEGPGPNYGACFNALALRPDYHFESENPEIATFVAPNIGKEGFPLVVQGKIIPDDQSGFLCTFKTGKVFVKIRSGIHQMRMPVTVTGGNGPCVDHPVLAPIEASNRAFIPGESPVPGTAAAAKPVFLKPPPPILDPLVIVLPPAPGPIAAPAPPASAAGSRKEEEEAEFEHQEDEGGAQDHKMMVLAKEKRSSSIDPIEGWFLVGTTMLMGMMLALGAASLRKREASAIRLDRS